MLKNWIISHFNFPMKCVRRFFTVYNDGLDLPGHCRHSGYKLGIMSAKPDRYK